MRYQFSERYITFYFDNPKKKTPSSLTIPLVITRLSTTIIGKLADALCRQGGGKSVGSQQTYVYRFFKPLLHFFGQHDITFPQSSAQWQLLLLAFMSFHLTDHSHSKASARSRIDSWFLSTTILKFWIEEEIIPLCVVVPSVDLKSEESRAYDRPLLGKKPKTVVPTNKSIKKLLVDIAFADSDEDFLNRIECECRTKVSFIKKLCLDHWRDMRKDHQTGHELAASISLEEIERRIHNRHFTEPAKHSGKEHVVTSSFHADGHRWALAKVQYMLKKGGGTDCVSLKTLDQSPFFAKDPTKQAGYTGEFEKVTAMPTYAFSCLTPADRFYRFSGLLLAMDVAAACCLLIMEHPQFTSQSLQNAELYDVHGKSYILPGNKNKHALFSVDKPRAGRRITVTLTPLSREIIYSIIQITQPVRTVMRNSGDKAWRFLFLGRRSNGNIGAFQTCMARFLNSKKSHSLISLYPTLSEHGYDSNNLNLRRIRNTMGVLRWFETGSIKETSRELGNSTRVVIEHYLPPSLLHAWNTRIIRRFQNTLIILAAHDENYLLEISDFSTMDDLIKFMAQLVFEYREGSSPIADDIHKKLAFRFRGEAGEQPTPINKIGEAVLNLRLSVKSLGYLYAFVHYASRHQDKVQNQHSDPSCQLTAQPFIDAAHLIRHACESEQCGTALRELLDIERLRRYHHAALAEQETLQEQFSGFSLSKTWGDACPA